VTAVNSQSVKYCDVFNVRRFSCSSCWPADAGGSALSIAGIAGSNTAEGKVRVLRLLCVV
jgi:hypothetical protein